MCSGRVVDPNRITSEIARHPPVVANHTASSQNLPMQSLYQCDLAYVHAAAFETIALGAAPEIVRRLQSSNVPIRTVMDLGCGAGPLTRSLVNAGFYVTGVDTSHELLQLARVRVPEA